MLADLLNVPKTQVDWDRYSFSLQNQITITRQAIQKQSNGADRLFSYQIDPVPFNEISDWLERVQQSLDDINQVLKLQGNDVTGVDFSNEQQKEAWVYNVYQQFNAAAESLGI